jgi:peptidoglycan hydrolase-like protein with peptidoglycan-binding domain
MNGFEEKNYSNKQPMDGLESPFITEELFANVSNIELSPRLTALESPFLNAIEPGQQDFISRPELEEEFVQESPYTPEQEKVADDETEADAIEALADLRDKVEEAFAAETYSSWKEEKDSDFEVDQSLEEEVYFSEETADELEEEAAYPLEEFLDHEEQFLADEMLIESEEPLPMLTLGAVEQNVQKLLSQGVFDRSLLERFAAGQIWNEDHLALEMLYQQQPKLRPAQLDKVSASERLKLLNWQAVKHARALTPIREGLVRPIFGDPANFQIGSFDNCQIQDVREQVRKLGPLEAGLYKGRPYYKRDSRRSPRDPSKVDCIVLHHMAFNRGNQVNSYLKVGAQYIVTADGQVAQLYDDLDYLNSSNNFNPRCVAIEFAGNFPRQDYHWWKNKERTIPDRCYLTPAQIRAGRCLLSTIKAKLPNIKYLYAHRQSSASRENDPGQDVWFNIGEWALTNLNLSDREPKLFEGDGQAIPAAWRMNRAASLKLPSIPAIPAPGTTKQAKPSAELTRFVQRVLNATEGERLNVDGDFGKLTSAALERFRQKYNLGSGNVLDEKTQLALAQRAFEEFKQQSMFPQVGVLDDRTREELLMFKFQRSLGTGTIIDAATRAALGDALERRTDTSNSGSTVPKPGPVVSLNKELVVTADTLNLRAAPSLQSNVIGSLRKGQVVSWLESSSDGQWHKVRKDNLAGWCFHKYLTARAAGGPLVKILQVAAQSEIAHYRWNDRGVAPSGYIKGMALVYARVYCKLKAGDAAVMEMAKANTGNTDKDALAHYAPEFRAVLMDNSVAGVDTLRHLFVLLIGLGMRESSGKLCAGRDRSAKNTTADTAEAGLFQASYNLRTAHPVLPKLFTHYLANPSGFKEVFQEGVRCNANDLENFGQGNGREFQRLSKDCPTFAAEFTAVGLRNRLNHWGPIKRKGAEIRPECDAMLLQVQQAVDQLNLCPLL